MSPYLRYKGNDLRNGLLQIGKFFAGEGQATPPETQAYINELGGTGGIDGPDIGTAPEADEKPLPPSKSGRFLHAQQKHVEDYIKNNLWADSFDDGAYFDTVRSVNEGTGKFAPDNGYYFEHKPYLEENHSLVTKFSIADMFNPNQSDNDLQVPPTARDKLAGLSRSGASVLGWMNGSSPNIQRFGPDHVHTRQLRKTPAVNSLRSEMRRLFKNGDLKENVVYNVKENFGNRDNLKGVGEAVSAVGNSGFNATRQIVGGFQAYAMREKNQLRFVIMNEMSKKSFYSYLTGGRGPDNPFPGEHSNSPQGKIIMKFTWTEPFNES